jgi:hypothetical protein
LNRLEQAFHQSRLLHEDAHEYEQRNRRQSLLQHDRRELEGHQIEDQIAEADVAEYEAEENQGEGNRKANKNGEQHAPYEKKSEYFGAHCVGHLPLVAA